MQVTLLIPAKNSAHSLENTVTTAHEFLKNRFAGSFEIILIPTVSSSDGTENLAREIAAKFPEVVSVPHHAPIGKGAALRTGFEKARGKWIFFTDADLPYDLEFFDRAAEKLKRGYGFVTGNRRLMTSYFDLPVDLLALAYKRHRLGLTFNSLVRALLPIESTDTQAGIKAMNRELAEAAFSRLSCPGFFFDLEFFLTARGHQIAHAELPVTLRLNTEKSTVRVVRESLLAAYWIMKIMSNQRKKYYYEKRQSHRKNLLARYPETSLGTRFFLYLRWLLTPYSKMASKLPPQGEILDFGSGHGLFSLALALESPHRKILGLDHDEKRIELAQSASQDLPNVRIEHGSMLAPPSGIGPFDGIAMIDVMHYFEPKVQQKLIEHTRDLLKPGGTLIVREVDPEGGFIAKWNRLYEKMATRTGFTQADRDLHFKSQSQWKTLFENAGFTVSAEKCSSFLFSDILYVCERNSS